MKRLSWAIAPAVVAVLLFIAGPLGAGSRETEVVRTAVEVLEEISAIPETGIPPSLLQNAHGIAVVPGVIKVGFVVGGRHGRGVVLVRDDRGGWSNPVFISLTGGSVGWQIGAQSTDVILVFKSGKSIDGIMKGKFTVGADAAVAAGPVGRSASASTDAQLKAEIYSYSRSRGLFAGVSVEGAALQIDEEANAAFYGKEGVRAGEILRGEGIPSPPAAVPLRDFLAKHAGAKAGE
ncbi:MAG: lipid-binding SYLF domain-containing protein [Candidatus Deferrimicrobiaceae bacterium]